MKTKLILLAIIFLAVGCTSKTNYSITGNAKDHVGDSIFLLNSSDSILAATIIAPSGEFKLTGYVGEPIVATLSILDPWSDGSIYLESGDIVMYQDDKGAHRFSGTPANNGTMTMINAVQQLQLEYPNSRTTDYEAYMVHYKELLRKNIAANASNIYAVDMLFNSLPLWSIDEVDAMYDALSSEMKDIPLGKKVSSAITALKGTNVGGSYIDLTLKDVNGQEVQLSKLLAQGKWVLLDFWATWCGPCKHEIPFMKSAFQKYQSKGLEIYAVSLDKDVKTLREYIEQNQLDWINLIGIDTDAAELYAVRTIPSSYLISPQGIIEARNLKGDELTEKLSSIFR